MKGFSGFGNSPMKQKGFIRTPEKFDHKASKDLAKQEFKKYASKTGHGTIKDLHKKNFEKFQEKITKAKKFVKNLKPQITKNKKVIKKVLTKAGTRSIPGIGTGLAIFDALSIGKKMFKGKSFKQAAKEQYL